MSTPSTKIDPPLLPLLVSLPSTSASRKSAAIRVDLPLPLRPTTPILKERPQQKPAGKHKQAIKRGQETRDIKLNKIQKKMHKEGGIPMTLTNLSELLLSRTFSLTAPPPRPRRKAGRALWARLAGTAASRF
jgi:hypothetical protein